MMMLICAYVLSLRNIYIYIICVKVSKHPNDFSYMRTTKAVSSGTPFTTENISASENRSQDRLISRPARYTGVVLQDCFQSDTIS